MTQSNEAGAVAWLSSMIARAAARRDGVLASDAEREKVCELLNSGFAEGRITAAELDERTTRALSARTHGTSSESWPAWERWGTQPSG